MAVAKGKSKRQPKNPCTALVLVRAAQPTQVNKKRDNRRFFLRMNAFLRAYEKHNGNISAACLASGVSRRSYYRWMDGTLPIYRTFQAKVARILPGERRLDMAERTIDEAVESDRNVIAAIFTLKTQGRIRGWGERPENSQAADPGAVSALLAAFEKVVAANPHMSQEERQLWIRDLSATGGVPEDLLVRRIRVLELTANV